MSGDPAKAALAFAHRVVQHAHAMGCDELDVLDVCAHYRQPRPSSLKPMVVYVRMALGLPGLTRTEIEHARAV